MKNSVELCILRDDYERLCATIDDTCITDRTTEPYGPALTAYSWRVETSDILNAIGHDDRVAELERIVGHLLPWADGALRKARRAAKRQGVIRLDEVPDVAAGADAVERARAILKSTDGE